MKILYGIIFFILVGVVCFVGFKKSGKVAMTDGARITLSEPVKDGTVSLEKAIEQRRSVRSYGQGALKMEQISQLLRAAQGITSPDGLRAAPSAGALYPIELYVVVERVEGLSAGVYKYDCTSHTLHKVKDGAYGKALEEVCLAQSSVGEAAINIVIAAVYARTRVKYGERATRYVHIEVGHVAQNIFLQSSALGLSMVVVGAFEDGAVKDIVGLQGEEEPLYVLPVGIK